VKIVFTGTTKNTPRLLEVPYYCWLFVFTYMPNSDINTLTYLLILSLRSMPSTR